MPLLDYLPRSRSAVATGKLGGINNLLLSTRCENSGERKRSTRFNYIIPARFLLPSVVIRVIYPIRSESLRRRCRVRTLSRTDTRCFDVGLKTNSPTVLFCPLPLLYYSIRFRTVYNTCIVLRPLLSLRKSCDLYTSPIRSSRPTTTDIILLLHAAIIGNRPKSSTRRAYR